MVQPASESAGESETPVEAENIESLKKSLAEEKAKAAGYLANWQRSEADYINYKRRCEQEKDELGKFANTGLILSILPILDDLERAFQALPADQDNLCWAEGFRLIERKLKSTLEVMGVSPIKAVGEPFDPRVHEAVRQDRGKEGIVIGEMQKGYTFRDRVIRPSQVVVGNGEGEEKEVPQHG